MAESRISLAQYNTPPRKSPDFYRATIENEVFISDWERYLRVAEKEGVKKSLAIPFPALYFPIGEDIHSSPGYRKMLAEGIDDPNNAIPENSLLATHFDTLTWELYQTVAGKIPVLYCRDRKDFEALLQAITAQNRPEPIPIAKGAQYFAGYINRERVNRYKKVFLENNPEFFWPAEFETFSKNKDLYCDKFIILSNSPYSNVSAELMGLEEAEWLEKSLILRREHECMHYIARRKLIDVKNNALDEIVADTAGMMTALHDFKSSWLLLFLGFDIDSKLRKEGRLNLYRATLSDEDFSRLTDMTRQAAVALEKLIQKMNCLSFDAHQRTDFLLDILVSGIEALCHD